MSHERHRNGEYISLSFLEEMHAEHYNTVLKQSTTQPFLFNFEPFENKWRINMCRHTNKTHCCSKECCNRLVNKAKRKTIAEKELLLKQNDCRPKLGPQAWERVDAARTKELKKHRKCKRSWSV